MVTIGSHVLRRLPGDEVHTLTPPIMPRNVLPGVLMTFFKGYAYLGFNYPVYNK